MLLWNHKIALLIIGQCLINFIITLLGNQTLIWIYYLFAITFQVYFKAINWAIVISDDQTQNIVSFISSWNLLKGLCAGLETKEKNYSLKFGDFFNYLGYMLYFPNLVFGPLIMYSDFEETYKRKEHKFLEELTHLSKTLLKINAILFVDVFALHFLHRNLAFLLPDAGRVSYAATFGAFYWNSATFYVIVLVSYSAAIAAAKAERIRAPDPPVCIFWITRYAYFWRHFDQGMYWFHKR